MPHAICLACETPRRGSGATPCVRAARASTAFARTAAAALFVAMLPGATGCGPDRVAGIGSAQRSYASGDFDRALLDARATAARATGDARDQARYLEGLSLLRLGRPREALDPLRDASDAADRTLAADACVSMGTAQVRCDEFADAAQSYRRAALLSDGAESRRAHSIAARCFDRAGLTRAAEESRLAAGEPASAPPVPIPPQATEAAPSDESAARTSTERTINGMAIEPLRYAIQAGAFSERARALEMAAALDLRTTGGSLGRARVVEKERPGASTVFAVQIGDFPNRVVAGRAIAQLPKSAYTVERYAE